MDGNSAPPPPDPYATAAAQKDLNLQTAVTQQQLNMVDQYSPDGSTLKYLQTGYNGNVPHFAAVQTLSPAQRKIYNTNLGTKQNLADIGNQQSGRIKDWLSTPFSLNDSAESKYEQMQRSRLDPLWAERAQQNEQQLMDRGIRPGSQAYESAMRTFDQGRNDAYNSMYVAGKGLFDQEALTERNQPLNEISALLSGSQVSQPSFVGTPQAQVAGTNLGGMVYDSYNAQVANQQRQQQQNNAMMGGLFGLGGSLVQAGLPFLPSDRRVKTDIQRIGAASNGLPLYAFRYVWGGPMQVGLMAQDVEKVRPEAVAEIGGIKHVNYDIALAD